MPSLITGLVKTTGYAVKVRRILFAQLKEAIKRGEINSQQVAYRAGRLNEVLYKVLIELLGLERNDVVRVSIGYTVVNGDIEFQWGTLSIEVYKYNEEISKRATSEAKEIIEKGLVEYDFELEKIKTIGTTEFYNVKLNGEKVGVVSVVDVGNRLAISGAITIKNTAYRVGGIVTKTENLEVGIRRVINETIINGNKISVEEAREIIGSMSI